MWPAWAAVGALILAAAFLLRVAVHAGRSPGGVDTWYYLAYADAFRARPGLDVRLPQYLLQDERQSYPPLFPMFLALLPKSWLRRWFWAVSPAIDCAHLALLYWLAFKITASLPVAAVTGCLYAFTPHLVAETRSLNGRSFGALLHSVAMVLALRFVSYDDPWPWLPVALLAGAAVLLASATSSSGYGFACLVLSVVFGDARYFLVAAGSIALAVILSGGHFLRVVRNYLQAVEYWRRNRRLFGAHPIRHSPVYGAGASADPPPVRPGFLGGSLAQEMLRLLGENPFILALPFAPKGVPPWGTRLYWWSVGLVFLSVLATLLPPLRAFGPGRGYLKAAVFPTAYTLGVGIGTVRGFEDPVGVATLLCLLASVAAIGFFYLYSRRQVTERTASVPGGLARAVRQLASLPEGGFLCLPYMYADYACYHSKKPVVWGGHCGDLRPLEVLAPVISRPIPELLREYGARYVLIDTLYVDPAELGLHGQFEVLGRWASFVLYAIRS